MGNIIFTLDSDLNIIDWNEDICEIYKEEKVDLYGQSIHSILTGFNGTDLFTETLRSQKQLSIKYDYNNKKIKLLLQLDFYPTRNGLTVSAKIISDNSLDGKKSFEGKKYTPVLGSSLEDLKENAERFKTLADNISQFAWMADNTGWIFWYNQRWYEYTGTTYQEMKGWGWKKVHHPDHIDRVVNKFKESIEKGESWEDTFPLRSKTGEYKWFLSRALPVHDKEGNIIRWFGTNTDITEQKAAEDELEKAYNRIERQLKEKEVLLKELYHRTKNNMQIISSLLGLKAQTVKDENLKEIVADMKNRIRSIALVHEKLYQSQNLSRINLSGYIKELIDLISQSYINKSKEIHFNLNLVETDALIDTAVALGLIITEIITNTLKHAFLDDKSGNVDIILKKENENLLELIISDDGIGFNKKVENQSEKLGLQIIRIIAEQLNATIKLDTDKGVSWQFSFPNELDK